MPSTTKLTKPKELNKLNMSAKTLTISDQVKKNVTVELL